MFILGLQGSPRIKGNTGIALSTFLDTAKGLGAECLRVDVSRKKITPCVECGTCEREGFCPINDEMQEVYPLLRRADLVVMATPIFFYSATAYMKGLIDRSQALWARKYVHKLADPKAGVRRGLLISLGATKGKNLFDGVGLTAKYFFDAVGARYEGALTYRKIEAAGEVRDHPTALQEIADRAKEMVPPLLNRKKCLFVCTQNACRSQMAAAFVEQMAGDRVQAFSAGEGPAEKVDPLMQEAMAEVGIDMAYARPKSLDAVVGLAGVPDVVVTMGCEGGCPVFADSPMQAWDLEDPAGKPLEFMRKTRDEIAKRVDGLVKALTASSK